MLSRKLGIQGHSEELPPRLARSKGASTAQTRRRRRPMQTHGRVESSRFAEDKTLNNVMEQRTKRREGPVRNGPTPGVAGDHVIKGGGKRRDDDDDHAEKGFAEAPLKVRLETAIEEKGHKILQRKDRYGRCKV